MSVSVTESVTASTPPRVRPEVVWGPGLIRGGATVHHVKDQRTGAFFQIGPREHFVFSRLDGRRELDSIGVEYAERFGRRLGPTQWGQLLGLLAGRKLLVGSADDTELTQLAEQTRQRSRQARTLLHARLPLVEPDRFLTALRPWSAPLFSRWLVLPLLVAVIVLEVGVLSDVPALFVASQQLWQTPLLGLAAVAVVWGSLAVHEVAHGVACTFYGGRVSELGVMWRLPFLAPYCKADDVLLFADRRHRVWTAFAGVFANLVVLLPFGVAQLLITPDTGAHRFCSAVLLFGSFAALFNLVPFLRLDGYYMLNHALGMVDLQRDSLTWCGARLRREPAVGPPLTRWVRVAYLSYAAAATLFVLALITTAVIAWFGQLSSGLGPFWAAAVLLAEGLVIVAVVLWVRRRRARRALVEASDPGPVGS